MPRVPSPLSLFLVTLLCLSARAEPIDPRGIAGSLVICGGGDLPAAVHTRFLELAGGEAAHLVVIPTASEQADKASEAELLKPWSGGKFASLTLLHTRSREQANAAEFIAPLQSATAVWFGGGLQSRIATAYRDTAVEAELYGLLRRGGVIGGTSAGAAIQSRLMIATGNPEPKMEQGFDLLPGSVIDQHFLARDRKPRLLHALATHPGYVGFGIDEGTAMVVRQRRVTVIGSSSLTVCLAASSQRPLKELILRDGEVADLTQLRRAARARAADPFPQSDPHSVTLTHGALVLGGGGRMPADVLKMFVELAGGPNAPIVVLPTAAPDPLPASPRDVAMLEAAGAENVLALCGRTREQVEDETFLATLRAARGIWFGGGRQWRFVDAYEGTSAYELMRAVLARGGVIGGSSAGASIQAEYLVRGHPLGNLEMMAEGYERGFGFLPGAAVDQHFARRKRFSDMTNVVDTFPQLLGIGIDESTALIVRRSVASVRGEGRVYIYDRSSDIRDEDKDYLTIDSGQRFDLVTRCRVE